MDMTITRVRRLKEIENKIMNTYFADSLDAKRIALELLKMEHKDELVRKLKDGIITYN